MSCRPFTNYNETTRVGSVLKYALNQTTGRTLPRDETAARQAHLRIPALQHVPVPPTATTRHTPPRHLRPPARPPRGPPRAPVPLSAPPAPQHQKKHDVKQVRNAIALVLDVHVDDVDVTQREGGRMRVVLQSASQVEQQRHEHLLKSVAVLGPALASAEVTILA